MDFISLLLDFKFTFISCSKNLWLHFLGNKKLLPKIYCFKMLIMQNTFFRIKKKTFIYETAHVTSRQNFLSHNSEYGTCQLHIESTHQSFEALKCLFPIRNANIAHLYFTKNFLWYLIVKDLTTTGCFIACANVYSFN